MPQSTYNIISTNGLLNIELHVGQSANTEDTSLTFIPKGYPNYGQIEQTNVLHMLEHFNGPTSPLHPIDGQIWFDSTISKLKVYDGHDWRMAGSIAEYAVSAPTSPTLGQFWYDTVHTTLCYWDGAVWKALAKKEDLITTGVLVSNTITLGRSSGTSPVTISGIASSTDLSTFQGVITTRLDNLIVAGTRMVFFQPAAPTGWTQVTTHNDKAIRIVSGAGGSTGGSKTFTSAFTARTITGTSQSHTLTVAEMPSHNHGQYGIVGGPGGSTAGQSENIQTGMRGGSGGHEHPLAADPLDLAVQYVDMIICSKN